MADGGLELVLIAAVAENGVIGRDGGMPWHYPEDLRRFKETTMGHPVVLGRRTYEAIADRLDGPLPGRTNVVLTSGDPDLPEGAVSAGSVEAALDAARTAIEDGRVPAPGGRVAYVAGGATVYEQFLPLADRLELTDIHATHDGDTYFPEVDWSDWRELDREDRDALSFVTYRRPSARDPE
jgi:dihydrofolate reductase